MNKYAFGLWLSIQLMGTSLCWNIISFKYDYVEPNVLNLCILGLWILGTTINTWFFYEWIAKEIDEWEKLIPNEDKKKGGE